MTKLIIAHSYPANQTDFRGRFIVDYMRSRPEQSFIVIAPHPEESFVETVDNYEVRYFRWKHRLLGGMKMYNPLHYFILLKMIFLFYSDAKKVVKQESISSIFACWALPGGIVAWLLKLFHGVHYSVWLLGTDVNKFLKVPLLLRTICNGADTVFANSDALKSKMGQVTDKTVEILLTRSSLPSAQTPQNGVEISHESFNVAFVGRLEKIKGIDIFLSIAADVKKVRKDAQFFVFGDGSLSEQVWNAQEAGIVKWAGSVPAEELSYYSEFIDVLLITARDESMPVVFCEFQNSAKILSFPVGDIPKHLAPENIMETEEEFVKDLTPNGNPSVS